MFVKKTKLFIANTEGQYNKALEKVNGWTIIEKSNKKMPEKLHYMMKDFERCFEYIHYKVDFKG